MVDSIGISARRESKSIVSIKSGGSSSSNNDKRTSKSLSCCSLMVSGLVLALEYMLFNNNLRANKLRSLITSKVSRLELGQKLRPLDSKDFSSSDSV